MDNLELQNVWKSYDQKLNHLLSINREVAVNFTKQRLNKQISKLYKPKLTAVFIGVPYTFLISGVAIFAFMARAYFVAIGFGAVALIMILLLFSYFYQLYLVGQVKNSDDILSTQNQLSKLRISSYQSLNLSVFQLPFWSICWISLEALQASPLIYGSVNLLVFVCLSYIAYWLYKNISYQNNDSKIRDFFLSGGEWEPIVKSADLLEQIKEYKL